MALITASVLNSRRIEGYSDHPELEVAFTLNTYPSRYEFRRSMQCDLNYFADPEMHETSMVAARQMLSELILIVPSDILEGLSEIVEELARGEAESAELTGLLKLELTIHAEVQLVSPAMTREGEDDAGEELWAFDGENLPTVIHGEDVTIESWSRFVREASRLQELGAPSLALVMGINLSNDNSVERAMRLVLDRWEEEGANYDFHVLADQFEQATRLVPQRWEEGEEENYCFGLADLFEQATRLVPERWEEEEEEENYGFVLGAVPASESAIESLKRCVLQEASGKDECTVCQEGYVVGEIVAYMPCKHQYHVQCIEQWLRISNMCPLCRKKFE